MERYPSIQALLEDGCRAPVGAVAEELFEELGDVVGATRSSIACTFLKGRCVVVCSVAYFDPDYGYLVAAGLRARRVRDCADCDVVVEDDRIVLRSVYGSVTVTRGGGAGELVGEIRGYKVYASSGYMDRLVSNLRSIPLDVVSHPIALAGLALEYMVVNTDLDIEWMAPARDPLEWTGAFYDDRLGVYVNPVFYDAASALAAGAHSVVTPRAVAEDLIHVAIHEAVHYHDFINGRGLEGTWAGNIFSALLGVPFPAGAEARAEDVAEEIAEKIAMDDRAVRAIEEYVVGQGRMIIGQDEDLAEAVRQLDLLAQHPHVTIRWDSMFHDYEWVNGEQREYVCFKASFEAAEEYMRRRREEGIGGVFESIVRAPRILAEIEEEKLKEVVRARGFDKLRVASFSTGFVGRDVAVCIPFSTEGYERVVEEE